MCNRAHLRLGWKPTFKTPPEAFESGLQRIKTELALPCYPRSGPPRRKSVAKSHTTQTNGLLGVHAGVISSFAHTRRYASSR